MLSSKEIIDLPMWMSCMIGCLIQTTTQTQTDGERNLSYADAKQERHAWRGTGEGCTIHVDRHSHPIARSSALKTEEGIRHTNTSELDLVVVPTVRATGRVAKTVRKCVSLSIRMQFAQRRGFQRGLRQREAAWRLASLVWLLTNESS